MIDFQTHPDQYKHWQLQPAGRVAYLVLDVNENAGLVPGYELKMNSYDLGVDIELYDAIQRLRFECPQVGSVVISSAKERIFCAGANIRMLAQSSHEHKVNFCKFTNETRNSIEDATDFSGQHYLAAINGNAAGGGYELALAADYLLLVDDGSTSVSLPEVPLLAVLPGTGGLTRVVDKRRVRRDLADVFCTTEEGVRGQKALQWGLVDEIVAGSKFNETVAERAAEFAARSDRPADAEGVSLDPLERSFDGSRICYSSLQVDLDRGGRVAVLTVHGPNDPVPQHPAQAIAQGSAFWPLTLVRELDDALLHLRTNEPELGTLIFKSIGQSSAVTQYDTFLARHLTDWFIRETVLYWKRTLKRIDLTSRTLLTLIEPDSCFSGLLCELVLAADRSYILDGAFDGDPRQPATIRLGGLNFASLTMSNGLTRLQTRFLGEPERVDALNELRDVDLDAAAAEQAGLVTAALDDLDWEDEIRLLLEERASFSPDALTGMEANLRFAGPETMESKIFARLSAWQNWIFQRPNAVGNEGALPSYGSGTRPQFDTKRV